MEYIAFITELSTFAIEFIFIAVAAQRVLDLFGQEKEAEYISYAALYLSLFPVFGMTNQLLWFNLAFLHGIAHLAHPAFIKKGTSYEPNPNYTPLWDYIIHAAQCLCGLLIFEDPVYRYFCYFLAIDMLAAGLYAHFNKKFLETRLWIVCSVGGIIGTIFHMLLLKNNNTLALINSIVWTVPYLGYFGDKLDKWDEAMNSMGLFKTWYFAYFVLVKLAY